MANGNHIELPIRAPSPWEKYSVSRPGKTEVWQDTPGPPNVERHLKKIDFNFESLSGFCDLQALICDWDVPKLDNSKKMLHEELQQRLIYLFKDS